MYTPLKRPKMDWSCLQDGQENNTENRPCKKYKMKKTKRPYKGKLTRCCYGYDRCAVSVRMEVMSNQ